METHGVQSAGQSTDSCHLTWGGMGYCYSRSVLSPLKVVFITCAFSKTNEQTNKQKQPPFPGASLATGLRQPPVPSQTPLISE